MLTQELDQYASIMKRGWHTAQSKPALRFQMTSSAKQRQHEKKRSTIHTHLALRGPLLGEGFIAQNLGYKSCAVHGRVGVHRTDNKLQLGCNAGSLSTNGKSGQIKQRYSGGRSSGAGKNEHEERGQPQYIKHVSITSVGKGGGS